MKIEKNIPLPQNDGDIFKEMEIGDSVFKDNETSKGNWCLFARVYGHRNGKKFKAKKEGNGLRIWRIE